MATRHLSCDIESYSSVDLRTGSVYTYSEAPDFQVLLFAYAWDFGEVEVLDLTKQELPEELIKALADPDVIKHAYNAQFERVCLSRYLVKWGRDVFLPPEQWRCTMVHAATLGLPRTLADVGRVLGLPEDQQKMKEGKALIQYFCKPCKPTKTNGGRTRNMPEDAPDKWATFIAYNKRDVETEMAILKQLEKYPLPETELAGYALDQRINDLGVLVDTELAESAVALNELNTKQLLDEAKGITGCENPKSVAQLKSWLGHEGALDKKTVATMRDGSGGSVDRVLAIRQELGKSSVSKYEAMLRGVCTDHRVRGLFAFYGANRTGRWAGRQLQVQNLPHDHPPAMTIARELVRLRDLESIRTIYGNPSDVLSQLVRTALVARDGYTFCVADFSAIEARVVAWLADCRWRQELFASGKGDIYCASASQMFHVPVEKHGINGHLRQKGKIAELALGYGGSVGALTTMGALDMGIPEDELKPLVDAWRGANPEIVEFWWLIDRVARDTIRYQQDWSYELPHGLSMKHSKNLLRVRLPSGRELRYWKPTIEPDPRYPDRENITYSGVDVAGWSRLQTYGPKLVENITQAVARDCLLECMLRVWKKHPGIVMHVHDEMIVEVPERMADQVLQSMLEIMATPIPWAPGLVLKGDGYITPYYRKD